MESEREYRGVAHYRPLGLLSNPFAVGLWGEPSWIASEVAAEAHRLLSTLMTLRDAADARPVWVREPELIDDSLFLESVSKAEYALANDGELATLHAYVPLPAMRVGSVRAILGVLAERLVFSDPSATLAAYASEVLSEMDTGLASFGVVGPQRLVSFAERFRGDPEAAVGEVFGAPELERMEEYAEVLDGRQIDIEKLGDDEGEDGEVDADLGVAPGLDVEAPEEGAPEGSGADAQHAVDDARAVFDYVVEHTSVHLSPVVARALRTYRERGQVAAAAEFRVTKAPRKTLAALVRLARTRHADVVILLSEFEYWQDIPENLRHKIVGALSELRWALGDTARIVFLAKHGQAPELEETFASAASLTWEYPLLHDPAAVRSSVDIGAVDRWLAAAAAPGTAPLTVAGTALSGLAGRVDDDLERFIRVAHHAVEDAAERGVATIDAEAVDGALRTQAIEAEAAAGSDA